MLLSEIFIEYDGRAEFLAEPEEWVRLSQLPDNELQQLLASYDAWRARGDGTPCPPEARLGLAANAELNNREINRRMSAAGRRRAVVAGVGASVLAAVLRRPRWWAYGTAAAVMGYGSGRFSEMPQGRW